jgi:hypothetical protein
MQCNICGLIIFATIKWYLQRINIKAIEIGRITYRKYCHVSGVCVTNNNGFWISGLNLLALLYNYSQ